MSVRFKRFIFYSIIMSFILLIASPFLITWVLNLTPVKNRVAILIAQKTYQKIKIQDFSISLFPQPAIKIYNLNYTPSPALSIAQIDTVIFKFNAIKLLQGQFVIDQAQLDHPVIDFTRSFKKSDKKDSFNFDLMKAFDFTSLFSYFPQSQNRFEILINNLTSPYFKRMDGSLLLTKNKSNVVLNASIDKINLNASDLIPIPSRSFLNFESIEIEKLNLFTVLDSNSNSNGRFRVNDIKINQKKDPALFAASSVEAVFKFKDGSYKIEILPFKARLPQATLGMTFHSTKNNSLIRFTGADIDLKQARDLALSLIKKNDVTDTLFYIIRNGSSPKIEVSFQNKNFLNLFDEKNLYLDGTIKNGVVNIPKTSLTATKVDGKASIKKGVLEIQTKDGLVRQSIIKKGYLSVDLLNHIDYPFYGEFSLDVDLAHIPETLISVLPGTRLAKELVRVHDVTGRCNATLTLQLPTLTENLIVKVNTRDFSTTGSYDRIPGKIFLENILFEYKPDIVTIKNAKGQINGNTINNVHTTINLESDGRIESLSGNASISLEKTIPWLMSFKKTKKMISPVKDGSGILALKHINLSGPVLNPEKWKFDVIGTGKKINLSTRSGKKEIENLSLTYDLKNEQFQFDNISMKSNDFSWLDSKTKPGYLDIISPLITINNATFISNKNNSNFKGTLQFPGNAIVQIDMAGPTYHSMSLKQMSIKDSNLSLADIRFFDKNQKVPINFTGKLNTITLNKILNPGSIWEKTIEDITKGEPLIIESDKSSHFQIRTTTLDISSLLSQLNPFSLEKKSFPKTKLLFVADKVEYNSLKFTNINSNILLSPNDLYIRINDGSLCDLKTTGYIHLKNNVLSANFPFFAKDKENIQELLSCLLGKENFMDGHYSIECNISSTGSPKDIKQNFNGDFNFIAEKGRIYKLTLLSRILSVINVSNVFKGKIPDITQKGFAYKKIVIEASIKDSVIMLKKAIIDGTDMTLIFSGTIDPVNDKINISCLVAPFKTVDLIIEKIPIINTLLSGRLVSVPVQLTGKFSDPVVIALHPSAVGKGLINMMTDILKTPIKLLDKLSNESNPPR